MTKTKNHNSIVFLTTLGLYLGLVLVSAAPQVLGQAATTRQFNIKDEIEFKDDLDKNPEGNELKAFLEEDYEAALSSFVEDLKDLKREGKYRKTGRLGFEISNVRRYCEDGNAAASSSFSPTERGNANEWIEKAFLDLHNSFTEADRWNFATTPSFVRIPQIAGDDDRCKVFGFDTGINKSNFTIRVTFSQDTAESAAALAGSLDKYFIRKAERPRNTLSKQLSWYTRAKADKNQVLIVTRLPRGSIDPLLAYVAPKAAKK